MGAREELLAAARALAAQGRTPFSPAEVIREARSAGSTYPDTTLRTFIVGPMCLNSPDHHAVQYGDLIRVGRGQYTLANAADLLASGLSEPKATEPATSADPSKPPDIPPRDHAKDWYWEGNVQAAVVRHLAEERWHIRRVADTASREHGVDIAAHRDGVELLVEVKGYPSSTYTSGARMGERKATPQPLHARQSYSHALLAATLLRGESRQARVVIAFPEFETFQTLARRTAWALNQASIEVWLTTETGAVYPVPVDPPLSG